MTVEISQRWISRLLFRGLPALMCLLPSVLSADSPSGPVTTDCLIKVLDQVELAASRDGILDNLYSRLGDEVERDAIAFELSAREAQGKLAVAVAKHVQADEKSKNRSPVVVAEVELELAAREYKILNAVGQVPFLEEFRARNAEEKSRAEVDVAKMTFVEDGHKADVTKAEVAVAQVDVDDRTAFSPITGTIVEQKKYEGEWCEKGDVVVKILRMDRLMLQGIINVNDIAPHQVVGLPADATFRFAKGEPVSISTVIQKVSPEVDLDGNYIAWAVVDNWRVTGTQNHPQWILRPGLSGTLEISPAVGERDAPTIEAVPHSFGTLPSKSAAKID